MRCESILVQDVERNQASEQLENVSIKKVERERVRAKRHLDRADTHLQSEKTSR